MIELGGNITLNGFKDRDYAELIVVKKIVGRYARQISDQHADFQNLTIVLSVKNGNHTIESSCAIKGAKKEAEATEKNLFVALDSSLKKLVQMLG